MCFQEKSQTNEDIQNLQIYRNNKITYFFKNGVHFIEQNIGAFKLISVIQVLTKVVLDDLIYYLCNSINAQVDFFNLQIYYCQSDIFKDILYDINGNKHVLKDLMNLNKNHVYVRFQGNMIDFQKYNQVLGLLLNASQLIENSINKINQLQDPYRLDQEINDLCQSLQDLE